VRKVFQVLTLLGTLPAPPLRALTCHPAEDAGRYMGKNICVTAHVYDVAQLADGTRFLDTCSPGTSDNDCRFTIASLPEDTRDVGDLAPLRGQDIRLRGTIHSVNGRAVMYLSRDRQLHGGDEKFRPNPALLAGFSSDQAKPPIHDRALRSDRALSGSGHFSVFRAVY
jgi:hypothetical protein